MRVKELIELLSKFDPDCKVEITDPGSLMVKSEVGWTTIMSFDLGD